MEQIKIEVTLDFDGSGEGPIKANIERKEEEGLSRDAHRLQTAMMLVIGKALQDFVNGSFGEDGEEDDE